MREGSKFAILSFTTHHGVEVGDKIHQIKEGDYILNLFVRNKAILSGEECKDMSRFLVLEKNRIIGIAEVNKLTVC